MPGYISLDLDSRREKEALTPGKQPFPHQLEAFEALNKTFKDKSAKSGLLVLPTGAGKTFTSVRWLCTNVLPKNIKIVWLAQAFHLLDQAAMVAEFEKHKPSTILGSSVKSI